MLTGFLYFPSLCCVVNMNNVNYFEFIRDAEAVELVFVNEVSLIVSAEDEVAYLKGAINYGVPQS